MSKNNSSRMVCKSRRAVAQSNRNKDITLTRMIEGVPINILSNKRSSRRVNAKLKAKKLSRGE